MAKKLLHFAKVAKSVTLEARLGNVTDKLVILNSWMNEG